jgi:glycosyltransferase involved in cell wall biosynthesis
MKLLLAHNRYRQSGGEDEVFLRESELLRAAGHEVLEYTAHNSEIAEEGIFGKAKLAARTLWAWDSVARLRALLRSERPCLAHFHNTFPLISPAAYYACQKEGIPVVQSLHNARLMCPAATFYRKGSACLDCLGRSVPWPGVVHACYRNSHLQTAMVAGMVAGHRILGTWHEQVDAYIVFTEFYRQKFISAGLPREKLFVKPHFVVTDPGMKQTSGDYALFLGRLAPEKGLPTLLKAWRSLGHVPLRIRGDGPLGSEVEQFTRESSSVSTLPYLSPKECFDLIKGARFLVWPSEGYYESFGLVAIEAFACGTPVIASRTGAMTEIVEDHKTGLHFTAGDADDLAAKVQWAWTHPHQVNEMGRAARAAYQSKYTAETNYQVLLGIYRKALEKRSTKAENSLAIRPLTQRYRT